MTDLVLVDRPAAGVAVVTLNRPAKYNALSIALLEEFTRTLQALGAEPDLRAVVVTGADPAFCAGLDLTELGQRSTDGSGRTLQPVPDLPVPLLGAINGVAITGGLEIALACDWRIASERARFADTHARVGVVPGWGLTARLPAAVGPARARQMSFTGDFVDAALALRIGLVNEVVPHGELLERAVALATAVTTTEPATLRRIREIYSLDGTAADALQAERDSAAGGLALADPGAFAARRDAVFARGRTQG